MIKPLFSIVIPVFNGERFISNTLTEIVQQEFKNYEVIVMNSCSSDQTEVIVHSVIKNHPQVRLITEKDDGIFDGMNHGIVHAKGDWLLFLGCDDVFYDRQVLRKVSEQLDESCDVVYGDVMWVPEMIPEQGEVTAIQHVKRCINHQRIFYRKDLFQRFGNYNCKYDVAADHDLNVRFFCNPLIKWKHVPIFITNYFSGGYSSAKYDFSMWNDWDIVFYKPFSKLLPKRIIYISLNNHYRELLKRGKVIEAMRVAWKLIKNVRSPGFYLLILRQFYLILICRESN